MGDNQSMHTSRAGVVSQLKQRLGSEAFGLLQAVSKSFQRGELPVDEYYETAVQVLAGDTYSLLKLVDRLPNEQRRAELYSHHAALVTKNRSPYEASRDGGSARRNAQRAGTPTAGDGSGGWSGGRRAGGGSGCSTNEGGVPTSTPWQKEAAAVVAAVASEVAAMPSSPSIHMRAPEVAGATGQAASTAAAASAINGTAQQQQQQEQEEQQERQQRQQQEGRGLACKEERLHSQDGHGNEGKDSGEVEDAGLCDVCMDAHADAQLRPCGHSMCRGCLALWRRQAAQRGTAAASCPFCREEIKSYRTGAAAGRPPRRPLQGHHGGSNDGSNVSATSRGAGSFGSGGRVPRAPLPAAARPYVVWLRRDLRLRDNPALDFAARSGRPVVVAYIWAPQEQGPWPMGGASRMWLHHSLNSLGASLHQRYKLRLRLYDASGSSSLEVLRHVAGTTGAQGVVWNRLYEPWAVVRDVQIEAEMTGANRDRGGGMGASMASSRNSGGGVGEGLSVRTFNGSLLYEPWDAAPDQVEMNAWNGGYGSVGFFLTGCRGLGMPPEPLEPPPAMRPLADAHCPAGVSLAALGLAALPRAPASRQRRQHHHTQAAALTQVQQSNGAIDWAAGIRSTWQFGEEGARVALTSFLEDGMEHFQSRSKADTVQSTRYEEEGEGGGDVRKPRPAPFERFRADRRYTARISPYIASGELSPREVYHAAFSMFGQHRAKVFLRRLAWRDLAYWALWRFPLMVHRPVRHWYDRQRWRLPWRGDHEAASLLEARRRWAPQQAESQLRAWQRGMTGYPLVDAGMRELWSTGYIPNYMRHVVAGFLIEYMNTDWRHGALWFHDTLCDADVAINSFMWQNGGHSGLDQWNFVMHPVYAAKAADPEGEYVRTWCPELARLPVEYIHCPWDAPATMLASAGIVLGRAYPKRIITDLEAARCDSLAAVVELRRSCPQHVLPDGHEALELPDGRVARLITRVDYRVMATKPVTQQAAADPWHASRRQARDPMATVMQDQLRERMAAQSTAGSRRFG